MTQINTTLEIVRRKTAELIPYARNSRTHDEAQVAQIAASMREWGWTNPILIDEENEIIAGHGRILAAQKLGVEDVPCIVAAGWTEAQKRAYVIADNQLAMNAGWNEEMLKVELADLKGMDFELDLIGFDVTKLNDLMAEKNEGVGDADAVPPVQETPISKLNDIWLLGEHRVMCGDSTNHDSIAELMGGVLADQYLTDPPYNVAYEGGTEDALTIQNDDMGDEEFREFLTKAFSAADRVMKEGAVFYIWHADLEGYNFRGACRDIGWQVRTCLVWNKGSLVLSRGDYHWKHEPCGWKEGAAHLWASDRKQTTVLDFDKPARNGEHPTMKPVDLIEYQILNNTKGQDIVLDGFGGSGTTLIACEKSGRYARIMELGENYVDVIVRPWQEFTGKEATLAGTEKTFAEVERERTEGA